MKILMNIFLFFLLLVFGISQADVSSHQNQKIILVLDWFVNPNHAPILVAKMAGFFTKHHLNVEILTPADPNDPPKWIAMRRADIAIGYQPHLLMQIERGLPIKQIGTLIDHPLNCLAVLESSDIDNLKDLKGKKIAYSAPEIDLLILKQMLKYESIDLKEVEPINVHYDLLQALLVKKVSASIGLMRNIELVQLSLLGKKARIFKPEEYGFPSYSELVFITNSAKKVDYHNFFLALEEARSYLNCHPEESWQKVVTYYKEMNNELNHKVWQNNKAVFASKFEGYSINQYVKLKDFLIDHTLRHSSESS